MPSSLLASIKRIFLVDVDPLLICTEPFVRFKFFSRSLMTALLALPFSAGAFTLILRVSCNQPTMQSLDDEGITLMYSFIFNCVHCSYIDTANSPHYDASIFLYYDGGKSFKQQRPDGLLVSQEQFDSLVCLLTKFLILLSSRASAFVIPKQ
jgi:hypothetical protein